LFSTWEVLRDAFIRGTLASTNINSFPTKQPGVHGPCAGSTHDEAYSERREQEVQVRSVSGRKKIQTSMIACKAPQPASTIRPAT